MAGKAGRGSDQFMIRLPDGMRDRIKAAADANGRSMNAEVVATLEEAYPAPEPDWQANTDAAISRVLELMKQQDYLLKQLRSANRADVIDEIDAELDAIREEVDDLQKQLAGYLTTS